MARTIRVTTAALGALVAASIVAMSGCGANDDSSSASSPSPAVANHDALPNAPTTPAASSIAAPAFGASATLTGLPADPASDPIAQNMQASLAADSQQVAPVMRYAPEDSSNSN